MSSPLIVTDLVGEWVSHYYTGEGDVVGIVRAAFVGQQGCYLIIQTEDDGIRLMDFWGTTTVVRKCTKCGKWDRIGAMSRSLANYPHEVWEHDPPAGCNAAGVVP